jgi:hypothetical protein
MHPKESQVISNCCTTLSASPYRLSSATGRRPVAVRDTRVTMDVRRLTSRLCSTLRSSRTSRLRWCRPGETGLAPYGLARMRSGEPVMSGGG